MNNKQIPKESERLEKQKLARRKRYAEIKEDPVLYEREKDKEKKRYQKRKQKKQIKSVKEEDAEIQKEKREKWREAAKKYRLKKKAEIKNTIKPEKQNEEMSDSENDLIFFSESPKKDNIATKTNEIETHEECPMTSKDCFEIINVPIDVMEQDDLDIPTVALESSINIDMSTNNNHEPTLVTSGPETARRDPYHDVLIQPFATQVPCSPGHSNTDTVEGTPLIVSSQADESNIPLIEINKTESFTKCPVIPRRKCLEYDIEGRIKMIRKIEYKKRQKLLLSIGKLQYENMELREKVLNQQRQLKVMKAKERKDDKTIAEANKNISHVNNAGMMSPKINGGIDKELEKIILDIVMDERRKNYSRKDFLKLDHIDPWSDYVKKHMKNNLEDFNEFKKVNLNNKMNKELTKKVSIFNGDITRLEVDALVNSTNIALEGSSGYSVDAAIHKAAGPLLQEECDTLGGCETGEAKITNGYLLPAEYIIHTVGPEDADPELLEMCYKNCLAYHQTHGIRSIAFPCIATGTFAFPNRLAAHIALRSVRKFLEENKSMDRVIFSVYEREDKEIYEKLLQMYFPLQELS